MSTRIYQGRVLSAQYDNASNCTFDTPAIDALLETFNLFQDAVNYHLVALAGMAAPYDGTEMSAFSQQVKAIWRCPSRNKEGAATLQQSIRRTLPNLPENVDFEDAIQEIFSDLPTTKKSFTLHKNPLLS